jgi:amidase
MNGITGLKPTWGRVSRAGVFALAESLDHVGPMTRSAADAADQRTDCSRVAWLGRRAAPNFQRNLTCRRSPMAGM